MSLKDVHIKVSNYKCFGNDPQGFEGLPSVSVVIGKNNTGKSALLDILELSNKKAAEINANEQFTNSAKLHISKILNKPEVEQVFQKGGSVGIINPFNYGQKEVLGTRGGFYIDANGKTNHDFAEGKHSKEVSHLIKEVTLRFQNPFTNKKIVRLLADRNISRQSDKNETTVKPSGEGATNIIQRFVNQETLNRKIVEVDLLNELNKIFKPDGWFEHIFVQQRGSTWEIFLEEKEKGLVSISNSGSGLKTIILVLIYTILLPEAMHTSRSNFIYLLEELENNLHPGLQRRLLNYIKQYSEEHHCNFILTTHSNVFIDVFAHDDESQIVHVFKDGDKTVSKLIDGFGDKKGILDDLDVRASDLLQSNCVIWVEGPSDRVYINHFINLWSEGALKEGTHYQCVFSGGSLLANYTIDEDLSPEQINALLVNKNVIFLMDSDRNNSTTPLKKRVQSIVDSIEGVGGLAWVTDGREIENYIPTSALKTFFGDDALPELDQYQKIQEYLLANVGESEANCFAKNKSAFAKKMVEHITKSDLENQHGLREKLHSLCSKISAWNGL